MGEVTVFVPDGCEDKVRQLAAELLSAEPTDGPNLRWLKSRGYSWEMHEYASFEPDEDGPWPRIAFDLTSEQVYAMADEDGEAELEARLAACEEFQDFKLHVDRGEVQAWLDRNPYDEFDDRYTIFT